MSIWLTEITEQEMKDVRDLFHKEIGTRIQFKYTGAYYQSLRLGGLTPSEYNAICELFPGRWSRAA